MSILLDKWKHFNSEIFNYTLKVYSQAVFKEPACHLNVIFTWSTCEAKEFEWLNIHRRIKFVNHL